MKISLQSGLAPLVPTGAIGRLSQLLGQRMRIFFSSPGIPGRHLLSEGYAGGVKADGVARASLKATRPPERMGLRYGNGNGSRAYTLLGTLLKGWPGAVCGQRIALLGVWFRTELAGGPYRVGNPRFTFGFGNVDLGRIRLFFTLSPGCLDRALLDPALSAVAVSPERS